MTRTKRIAEEIGFAGVAALATGAVLATAVPTPGGLLFAALACAAGLALLLGAVAYVTQPHPAAPPTPSQDRMPDELNAF